MFKSERNPLSAAVPPSAAEPAAGIASIREGAAPPEALSMPAAPFSEESAPPMRLHAIGDRQCRWIIADEDAGAEALMCGAPTESRRPFCAAHCARAYVKPPEEEAAALEKEAQSEEEAEEEERE